MVLALVIGEHAGRVRLVAQPEIVDELDAALPVAVEEVARGGRMDLVLAAGEIPHEIAPVHPVQLVVEEVVEVVPHRRLADLRAGHDRSLAVGVGLVEGLVAPVGAGAPHTREQHLAGSGIAGPDRALDLLVFAVDRRIVGRGLQLVGRTVVLAVDERVGAVLLAGQVAHEREGVVRLVFVGRRLGAGADDVDAEHGEAHDDRRRAEQDRVEEDLVLLERAEQAPEEQGEQRDEEEGGAGVVRQAERVDEEQVEICRQLGQVRDEQEHEQADDDHAQGQDLDQLPEREALVLALAVEEHEHQGRDGQQVQQVHADAQAHQEGDEHDPAQGVRLVGAVVPHCHQPEYDGREQRGHRVDLGLDGREPEGVGEGVDQGAHEAGAEDGDGLRQAIAAVGGRAHQALGQPDDGQVQEKDRRGGAQRAERVDEDRRVHVVAEQGEEPGEKLEDRVSRRVADFEFIGRCDELAAIPERSGRLDGQQIGNCRNHKGERRADPVP